MSEARIPPHNLEAERAVLGALLTGSDVYDSISTIVNRDDFYRDGHRVIYEASEHYPRQSPCRFRVAHGRADAHE